MAWGNPEAAEPYCDIALAYSPEDPDLWVNKGRIALLRQDTAQAKQHFLQALKYKPDHRQALIDLGSTYLEEGALRMAEATFRQCLYVEAGSADCQVGLE
ncbi:tetratricopeptide repeat protein [Archangium violaceum]|uniref:tetratricopeptide repeat protein n=1 Tax=Archangium violaceum TaxID=83451 RepID=UPI002B2C24B7|nr:tetratricopeptide repeat protein [Archangium violaceum]